MKLNRVGQLREHFLICKEIHFESLGDIHLLKTLFSTEIFQVPFLGLAGATRSAADIRNYGNCLRSIAITDSIFPTLSLCPDLRVAIRSHDIEHLELMLKHLRISLAVNKFQSGAPTPNIIPVGRAVAVVPMPVFIKDCFTKLLLTGRGHNFLL